MDAATDQQDTALDLLTAWLEHRGRMGRRSDEPAAYQRVSIERPALASTR
ncbi:hypothetical protein ACFP3Q_18270 [Nocardioides sp. GCM10027113]